MYSEKNDMLFSLNCLISGQTPNDIFTVPIGEFFNNNQNITIKFIDMTVAILKEQLFSRDEINKAKITDMNIWKAEIKLDSLVEDKTYTEEEIKEIKGTTITTMKPGCNLNEYFDNDEKKPEKNHLHIFVVPTSIGETSSAFSSLKNIFLNCFKLPTTIGKRKAEDSNEKLCNKKVKQIELSSPESIVRFLTEDEENKKWIKTDFKPNKLCGNEFNFKREGRDDALFQVYDYIYDRHRKISNSSSLGEKKFHPLFALQSAPGGGKSFFFDELASLKSEDIIHYKENHPERINDVRFKETIDIITNSIGVCITYNGSSPYNENFIDGNIRRGLIMRVLWSYFFDEKKLDWIAFCKKFGEYFASLDTYTVIGSVIHHSGKSVLLCIDETMRVLPNGHEELKNIETLLNELYGPYQAFSKTVNKFYFVISTLDTLNVLNTQTYTRRPIYWIPLRRLILSESANLFRTLVRNLDKHRLFVIDKCISDCNGHPRTLEELYQVINGDDTTLNTDNYNSLMERLAKNLKQLLSSISLSIVRIALIGNEKSLTDKIKTVAGKSTLRDLISSGIYINSLTDEELYKVIPTLSPVALQYFCIRNKNNKIAKILRRLLTTESTFDEEVMDGKPFERFHTNWELLYRALQGNGKNVSLRNIYGLPDENWKGIEIQLQQKEIAYCHNEIEFPPNSEIYDTHHRTFESLIDYVFVPEKSNNSGFDMVIFDKKSNGSGYIAINFECRFSYPNKTTTLQSKEILDKYNLMKNKYLMHVKYLRNKTRNKKCWEYGKFYGKSAVGKLKMSEDDLYLVVVSWRNIGILGNDILDNENIIIVDRDNLKKIYTPSLVTRPQFYSDVLQQIKGIRYEN